MPGIALPSPGAHKLLVMLDAYQPREIIERYETRIGLPLLQV
jgi:hypothetical protein